MARRDLTFDEWRQENIRKAPASGGIRTPLNVPSVINANISQPPATISDVRTYTNWFSPEQPVAPFGPPNITRPWEWDYPTGYNLNYIQPRMELMSMLRAMRASWGVLATIISTRQDQLLRVPWTIQQRGKPKTASKAAEEIKKFLRRPDGKLSYSQWTRLIVDDLLVLDAPCIYFYRDRSGRPLLAQRLDPVTIFPLIDDIGRRPDTVIELTEDGLTYIRRQPAFQQIIKGQPMVDLDESEIMYVPMRPKAECPLFGYPGTEQILIEAGEAIRKTIYQFNFWAEGTIPDLIVTVPDDWSPNHIAMFQAHTDALLSGNLSLKSKIRFLPGGMKPFDIKNANGESLWSQRDETLIRLACYAYSANPAPFIKMLNRSTAQNAQQTSEAEGLFPLMSFWKDDIMDPIIQEKFGYEDIEFVFLSRPEPDGEKRAKIHQIQIREGLRSRNEIRIEEGEEPMAGGDIVTITAGNAIIPLEDAAKGLAMPVQGGAPQNQNKDSGKNPQPGSPGENEPQRNTTEPEFKSKTILKVDKSELRDAQRAATGHLYNYSSAKLEAGNYKKGHIKVYGFSITIENAPGSIRGKKTANGDIKWQVKMPVAYGYIKKTEGADGDHVDVYIGKSLDSNSIWIIDQNKVKNNKIIGFDEHKCFIGFRSLEKVIKTFLRTRKDGILALGKVVELSVDEFKNWIKNGDTKSPAANQIENIVFDPELLEKFDTISTATNLVDYNYLSEIPKKKKKKKKITSGPRWLRLSVN